MDILSDSTYICRACLQCEDSCFNVNEASIRAGFEELAGILIKPQDGLPQTICSTCKKNFIDFLEFKKIVLNSNEYLSKNFSTNQIILKPSHIDVQVKVEVKDEIGSDDNCQNNDDITTIVRKKNKKKRQTQKESKMRPKRKFINLDPEKIRTLTLSLEEQQDNHHACRLKQSFVEMAYKCMKCYVGFNYERKLENHMQKCHVESKPHHCEICAKTFIHSHNYYLHKKIHDTRYQCCRCEATFVDKCNALTHYTGVHEGVTHSHKCKYCDKLFKHRSTLNYHMKSQHDPSARVPCPICSKILRNKDSMDVHLERHKGKRNYSCNVCSKKFYVKKELSVHMLSHSNNRDYYCEKCDVQFKTLGSLNTHFKTSRHHVDVAKHICSDCGKAFFKAFSLRVHYLTFHDDGPKEKCPHCQKLVSVAAMKYHLSHHKTVKSRDHICHECAKSFKSRATLNRHLIIHTGLKPFECVECSSSFNQKATLNTHIRLVHMKLKRKKSDSEKQFL